MKLIFAEPIIRSFLCYFQRECYRGVLNKRLQSRVQYFTIRHHFHEVYLISFLVRLGASACASLSAFSLSVTFKV